MGKRSGKGGGVVARPLIPRPPALPLLRRFLAARGTPRASYRGVSTRLKDALRPGLRVERVETLTPAERLAEAARSGGLDPRPLEEFAEAHPEHSRIAGEVRAPYEAVAWALSGLLWRLPGAFKSASPFWALRHRLRAGHRSRYRSKRPPTARQMKGLSL